MNKGKLKVGTERERHAQWAHHVCVALIAYFLLAFADLKKMQTNRTYSARYENCFCVNCSYKLYHNSMYRSKI